MATASAGTPQERVDFSRVKTTIPIPNLIEVQKRSYERFLQMDLLPSERDDIGLQSVFQSVFPITDFRGYSELEFVDYTIGNWECKCGHLKGLNHLRTVCRNPACGAMVRTDPFHPGDVICPKCGTFNKNVVTFCPRCGDPVGLQLKYDQAECEERGMTFAAPLKVTIRLKMYDKDEQGNRSLRDMKEQEVFFGEIPLMTPNGTFIINGTERVIVSQLHRSPGVFFERLPVQNYFLGKIIPYRGSWVEFEYDNKNLLYVRIDRKRKFYGTVFLRALGMKSDSEILKAFYRITTLQLKDGRIFWKVDDSLVGMKLAQAITAKNGEVIHPAHRKVREATIESLKKAKIEAVEVTTADLEGAWVASDVIDMETGEVLAEANQELTSSRLAQILDAGIGSLEVFFPERDDVGVVISATLKKDPIKTPNEALMEIYKKLRPGDPPTLDTAQQLFHGMFFDPRKYDFSRVGRMKFNIKIYDNAEYAPEGWIEQQRQRKAAGEPYVSENPLDRRTLDRQDFIDTIRYLLRLRKGIGTVDDIDHLGNRRVRAVGELLENQFRIGLVRMERAIKEKMAVYQEMSTAMPHDLVNAKPVMAAIREFFGSSQLSQFMDQTNPLSEITHKRRLSALGPGGLSRERAGFEVRDVHPTHYGRICPIETPEGPNIGLISSLSCFARINEYGFIESPYRRVVNGVVQDEVRVVNPGGSNLKVGQVLSRKEADRILAAFAGKENPPEFEAHCDYLSAWDEDRYVIAQANLRLDKDGRILDELVNARKAGNFTLVEREQIQYMDVSPKQLVSVAASLIPFLENDDANRALMGSNMQRQAVPLLRAEAPIVGTGMEAVTARDSGAVVICRRSGIVDSVDSERIIVRVEGGVHEGQMSREVGADIYPLIKFKRSNQNTCINQKPIVKVGQRVKKGDVLADGPCTDHGELALGRNVLVAFMPWRGYNFEDAIIVSEKLVKEDWYTSIHIEEFETEARDTKLGPEEITRDIPNISESFLKNLDESGIIRIGAKVKPGDILVGKVTPKGETQLTPEEKLLRAIFGEKAGDVKDASLYCPAGIEGVVVDAKVFSRKGADQDERSRAILEAKMEKLRRNLEDEKRILADERAKRLEQLFEGKELLADLHDEKTNKKLLAKGTPLTRDVLEKLKARDLKRMRLSGKDPRLNEAIDEIEELTSRQIAVLEKITHEKIEKLKKGDELPPGVIKVVKVYIAMRRKLSVGDKMAGRHGNKGVISKVVPEEDMPYLEDGTPVEIILNPLGVPSRMNVGQILETHLGWAGLKLGKRYATPVFDGATEEDIKRELAEAGIPTSGKVTLYDGMTGQPFEQPVTVGVIYMLKLSHLVDDKIHARSIGPYSLITQQPLGGKAQFGGQRFGEMEVWALEAYGAAYVLQELLTVKSDDVYGRAKIYEAIVKGQAAAEPGVPESFNVLIRELQALCLDVELIKRSREPFETALAAD
ncbi:MAG: DNA-directed RNA polymerase subunit beta [Bryobacteraceae bacterium]|nr:MAG: DNA-directed RNA polymerase subunit beta [Bryobacteraceae bacterium]